MNSASVQKELGKYASPKHSKLLQRYFKTGKGEYAEGDIFVGLRVPVVRKIAQRFKNLAISEIEKLLHSKIHEDRLTALMILVDQFQKADQKIKQQIVSTYLENTKYINNWDLVDLSAHKIVGKWLLSNPNNKLLRTLAKSKSLWERRISIISTFAFIDQNKLDESISLSKILLNDKHDLIHKAVGWVLREVGKKDQKLLEKFLKDNYSQIPRTTIRYAIEKFPQKLRLKYLKNPNVSS